MGNKKSSQDNPLILSDAMRQLVEIIDSQRQDIHLLLAELREIEDWTVEIVGSMDFLHHEYHMPGICLELISHTKKIIAGMKIDKAFSSHYSRDQYLTPYTEVVKMLEELSGDLSVTYEDYLSFAQMKTVSEAELETLSKQVEYNLQKFSRIVFRFVALVMSLRLQLFGEFEEMKLKPRLVKDIEATIAEAQSHES